MRKAPGLNRMPPWTLLVEALRESSVRGHLVATFDRTLERLQQSGWDVCPLQGWIADPNDIGCINRVYKAMGRAMGPSSSDQDQEHALTTIEREFGSQDESKWRLLSAIAKARLSESPGFRRPASSILHHAPAAPPLPSTTKPRVQITLPAVPSFGPSDNRFTIYIDESWPEDIDEGVIAGVVWRGESPNYSELMWMATHSYKKDTDTVSRIIARLYACPRSFPFILPIQVDGGTARSRYDDLIGACLQIVLGWLLPCPPVPARVSVQLERIGPHLDGSAKTEYYRGLLRGASQTTSSRFSQWDLVEVRWCPKDDGYIPYADLLAHLALEHTDKNRSLGEIAKYRQLPGYLPFSFDLVPLLMRLDGFDSSGNVGDVLDVAARIWGTRLSDRILDDLRGSVGAHPRLQRCLTEELDRRYMAKDRDLVVLHRQVLAVRRLLGPLTKDAGVRLNLLCSAIELQDANHLGNPAAVDATARAHAAFRDLALQHDRELTVHTDLHLAVHEVDTFRFDRAEILMEEIRTAPWFSFLSPYHRAAVLSSLGQHRSIGGQHQEAEEMFATAIDLFDQADLNSVDRTREISQTAVYRAMNANDGDLPGWADHLAHAVCSDGESLEAAAARLAMSDSPGVQYQHHLLTRTLFFRRGELDSTANAYLDAYPHWSDIGTQHPAELTALYRVLLRRAAGGDGAHDGSIPLLRELLTDFGGPAAGATLRLIGAMIATVGCCCGDAWCGQRAQADLTALAHDLPDAAPEIGTLFEVLDSPSSDRIGDALCALPFNFH